VWKSRERLGHNGWTASTRRQNTIRIRVGPSYGCASIAYAFGCAIYHDVVVTGFVNQLLTNDQVDFGSVGVAQVTPLLLPSSLYRFVLIVFGNVIRKISRTPPAPHTRPVGTASIRYDKYCDMARARCRSSERYMETWRGDGWYATEIASDETFVTARRFSITCSGPCLRFVRPRLTTFCIPYSPKCEIGVFPKIHFPRFSGTP
jgi:hypothetical protein